MERTRRPTPATENGLTRLYNASVYRKLITQRLKQLLPGDSVIARVVGEEFMPYLDSVGREEPIAPTCRRLRDQAHTIQVATITSR